ncbi:MAG: hypothetical protein U1E50_05075 [Caulobacteraceae bacterium]
MVSERVREDLSVDISASEEARLLVRDLRDAARDGRMLAERYADILRKVVDEYCIEFEARADALLARIDAETLEARS